MCQKGPHLTFFTIGASSARPKGSAQGFLEPRADLVAKDVDGQPPLLVSRMSAILGEWVVIQRNGLSPIGCRFLREV